MISEATARAEADIVAICVSWPEWVEVLSLSPNHFHDPRWRAVYGALMACSAEGEPISEPALWRRLERTSGGEESYRALTEHLATDAPITGDHAEHLAGIVRDGYVARGVYEAAGALVEAYRRHETGEELLTEAMRRLSSLELSQPDEAMSVGELMRKRYQALAEMAERRLRGESACTGIPTGIDSLDEKLGGLQRGVVTMIAARPAMGKSALGMTVTDNVSKAGIGVHVFSLEDARDRYADRILSRHSGVAAEAIRGLNIAAGEVAQLQRAANEVYSRKGWLIDDRSGISAEELVRSVRRARRRNETQVVVVDYVQLMAQQRGENKQQKLDRSINVLADAAKQDSMAYVVMSQMNRGSQDRDDKRPTLSDLRGAGELEERAKVVLGLHRPAYYGEKVSIPGYEKPQPAPEDLLEILVLKQNDGETGSVEVNWHGPTMRIW